MKKMYLLGSLFLFGILMSSSLVSAGWFDSLFNRDSNLVGQAYVYTIAVKEQVKCVFKDSTATQVCSSNKGSCKGVGSCVVTVRGKKGEQVTWKSSCGGYAYTTMDGQNDVAEFKCSQDVTETVKCVMWDATSPQECYSEKGSCKGKVQKDSTGRTYVSCGVDVSGKKGEQVTWKSSCGGYAYTTMDGQNDVAEFKCSSVIPPQTFYKAFWECYDGYYIQASGKKPLTSETWKKYAEEDCKGHCYEDNSKCGVNSFGVLQ